jgi:hypothetical protein
MPKIAGRNSHRVIHHGTKPANANGAMTKKRAEPKMAIAFDTAAQTPLVRLVSAMSLASRRGSREYPNGDDFRVLNFQELCEQEQPWKQSRPAAPPSHDGAEGRLDQCISASVI